MSFHDVTFINIFGHLLLRRKGLNSMHNIDKFWRNSFKSLSYFLVRPVRPAGVFPPATDRFINPLRDQNQFPPNDNDP